MSHCVYQNTLLDDIIREHPLPRQLVKRAALEVLDIIREGLLRDGSVRINNFGTFRIKRTAPRRGRNPKTGEPITIPPRNTVMFAPCKALREQLEARPVTAKAPETPRPTRSAAMSMAAQRTVAVRSVALPPALDDTQPEHTAQADKPAVQIDKRQETAPPTPVPTAPPSTKAATIDATPLPLAREAANSADTAEPGRTPNLEPSETERKRRYPVWLYTGSAALAIGLLLWQQLDGEPDMETPATALLSPAEPTPAPSPALSTQSMSRRISSAGGVEKAVALEAAPLGPPEAVTPAQAVETTAAAPLPSPVSGTAAGQGERGDTFFVASAHTISSGDSLWRLAEHYYGDPLLWPHIYQANAEKITNPDFLRSGRTLTIPQLQGPPSALSETDRRHIAAGYFMTYLYYRDHGHRDAFFALLEAKRYSAEVVEERQHELDLTRLELILLAQQQPLKYPQPFRR